MPSLIRENLRAFYMLQKLNAAVLLSGPLELYMKLHYCNSNTYEIQMHHL
jgi:hypothetical protein